LRAGIGGNAAQTEELLRAQAEAEAASALAAQGMDFADATGPSAVRGKLSGTSIALVRTSDTSDEDLASASSHLVDAGAVIGSTTALAPGWTDPDRVPFRDALADQIVAALPEPPQGSTTEDVLATALAQALATGGEFDPEGQERADTLWLLLTEAELVTGERSEVANMFVLVTPGGDVSTLARAFAAESSGVLVGFTGTTPGEATPASTVTNAAGFYGAWAVVGAAINLAGGITGAYDASDADELIAGPS